MQSKYCTPPRSATLKNRRSAENIHELKQRFVLAICVSYKQLAAFGANTFKLTREGNLHPPKRKRLFHLCEVLEHTELGPQRFTIESLSLKRQYLPNI